MPLAVEIGGALLDALSFGSGMLWQILWALVFGFTMSAAIQAVVSKQEMRRVMPDDSPRSVEVACRLRAASSSCSYAAVAMAQLRLPPRRRLHLRDGVPVRGHPAPPRS